MLPTTVIDYRIDYRYFILASGKKSSDNLGQKEDEKVIFIDDLIPPSRKHYTIEKFFKKLSKIQEGENKDDSQQSGRIKSKVNQLKKFYNDYKSRKLSPFHLLQEFEDLLGVRQGIKAFWGLAICHTSSHSRELHETLRRSILKMKFRNENCILNYEPEQRENDVQQVNKKFSMVYKKLIKRIMGFLRSKNNIMPALDERHLNQIISNFYEIDICDMLQGWKLKTYVSPESRDHILKTFMCDEREIETHIVKIFF